MRKFFAVLLLISFLFSLLTACGDSTATQPVPTSVIQKQANTTSAANPNNTMATPTKDGQLHIGSLAQIFPQLKNMPDTATSISVDYNWNGLADVAPISVGFTFQRKDDQFAGEGQFSIQTRDTNDQVFSSTSKLNIPTSHVHDFLQQLTQIPLEEGTYVPKSDHTDDYPATSLFVVLGSGETLDVYTRSQNELTGLQASGYAPWAVSFEGRTFVVHSDAPYRAYQNIYPDLQIDNQIDKLVQTVEKITPTQRQISATPTHTTPPVPTEKPTIAKGTLAQVFPQLAKLPDTANLIAIDYSWDTVAQSIRTQIITKRSSNQFIGSSVYNVGAAYTGGNGVSSTANITIPADHAQKFLQGLTQIPLAEGPYTAFFQHTDDYLTLAFNITLANGEILKIYTSSQDAFDPNTGKMVSSGHVPWAVEFQGRTFVVNNDAAYQAYQNIYPDLQIDAQIKKLEQGVGTTP